MPKHPIWWAEYKCPECGYTTIVTNICRSCERWMYATGYEEHGNQRRRMTKSSETYNNAILASHFAQQNDEMNGKNIPEWAWFGEEKPMKVELNKEDLETLKRWLHAYWFMTEEYTAEDEKLIQKLNEIEEPKSVKEE